MKALFGDLIAEAAEQSVSATVRETVQAVAQHPGISVTALGRNLGIDKSTASRRVDQAIEKGYLVNADDRKGYSARLILGEPLPEDAWYFQKWRCWPTRGCCTVALVWGSDARLPRSVTVLQPGSGERCRLRASGLAPSYG